MRPEPECRRPEFAEGVKVKLGDGQEWTFPKPVLRLVPVRKDGGGFGLEKAPPYGPDYQADLVKYIDAARDEDGSVVDFLCLRIGLAAALLARNYDLTDAELQELLYFEQETDEATAAMWEAIDAVVLGNAPKPSAVGSDASSSPTA